MSVVGLNDQRQVNRSILDIKTNMLGLVVLLLTNDSTHSTSVF
jgi:hypothetical protein